MLPQPQASVDPPPASEAAKVSRRKRKWLMLVGILAALGCLLLAVAPFIIRPWRGRGSSPVETVNNLRQIGMALAEFETEYGSLPSASTTALVAERSGSTLLLDTESSNGYFRQLMASGIVQFEHVFYARGAGVHKADGNFDAGYALEKGECGFTYFLGAVTTDNPGRPLVVAPMIPGTDRFDRKALDGKAVILTRDDAVMTVNIDEHGHIIMHGRNLMDPAHPVLDGHAPSIAWPDL